MLKIMCYGSPSLGCRSTYHVRSAALLIREKEPMSKEG
jgi:hypothetical protein